MLKLLRKKNKRLLILSWLHYRVFKRKEGEIMHPVAIKIRHWMFPFAWLYERQSGMRWDQQRNLIWIAGKSYSPGVFTFLADAANEGKLFRLEKVEEADVLLREIREDQIDLGSVILKPEFLN